MNTPALILGLTGSYGGAMAQALHRAGHPVRALVRDRDRGARAAAALGFPVDLVEGDVLDPRALSRAARGASVIVHGVNAPYHRWEGFVVEAGRAVAEVAVAEGATVLLPGNVYPLPVSADLDEGTPFAPPTRKGELRVALERVLRARCDDGMRLIVLRGGDFFGIPSDTSWLQFILGKARQGGALRYPGPHALRHQWAYLPDYVRAHVALLDAAGPGASDWHFQGHVVTGEALLAALRDALGDPSRKVSGVPWPLLAAAGWVSPLLREIHRMRYLWQEEVLMRGDRLRTALPSLPHTPLAEAVAAHLALPAQV